MTKTKIQIKCTLPKVTHLSSNQYQLMVTNKPQPWWKRMCMTLRHQELRFWHKPLPMSYLPILNRRICFPSRLKQSCWNGTTAWDAFLKSIEALSIPMYTPKEAPQGQGAQVCWVTLWRLDKASMANKVHTQPRLYPGIFRPWLMHISWSDGFQHSRIYRQTQGQSHQAELPHRNNLPG